jgi:hypothetical protein
MVQYCAFPSQLADMDCTGLGLQEHGIQYVLY